MGEGDSSRPILSIDLNAVVGNYHNLQSLTPSAICVPVVKANGYGLGAAEIALALAVAGARRFCVATLEEGIALRKAFPKAGVWVLHGPQESEAKEMAHYHLVPVLNSRVQIERWAGAGAPYSAVWHVDTGMNRLGFSAEEVTWLAEAQIMPPAVIMSHLACPGEPDHPMNEAQRRRFEQALALLPAPMEGASLCSSSGIFLDASYHYRFTRPGMALYGLNPTPCRDNPMKQTVTLDAPILQMRNMMETGTAGYGATYSLRKGSRLAVLGIGYADGIHWAQYAKGTAVVDGVEVPFAGRISMDLITLDVTAVPEQALERATHARLIGDGITPDLIAERAGTIGYDVLTRLGNRIKRNYVKQNSMAEAG